ncbi:MAG: glycogen synthase [Myxococcales bacterium]|nr:glycogen synthase [Myxococcales bacterium]
MRILMASTELAPIIKVGGLADAVAALSKTLSRLGHELTIVLPHYRAVEKAGLMLARRLTPLEFDAAVVSADGAVSPGKRAATLFDVRLGSGLEVVFIDIPGLFDRDGIYDDGGEPYKDDALRFGQFSSAVAALAKKKVELGQGWGVVHAHDWMTALVPYFIKKVFAGAAAPRTVLTVHNAAHQGRFPMSAAKDLGLDAAELHPGLFEFYGELNFLKAGLLSADIVTTVSPTYALELTRQAPTSVGGTGSGTHGEPAAGLDGVLRGLGAERFVGILNGVDYASYSPVTDPHIVARFDAEDARNKGRCKASLLSELGLSVDPERPLVVALGRVCLQKGSDVLADAVRGVVRTGAVLVVAGSGDPTLSARLEQAISAEGGDAVFLGQVSEAMSHRLIAAADAVVMPSRFEPCGLVQQYAQRYGAAPIARSTGGLVDTIVDCDAHLETGTGFLFDEATAEALVGAVARAVAAMRTPAWASLRRRIMRLDRSWERPARQYLRVYQTR